MSANSGDEPTRSAADDAMPAAPDTAGNRLWGGAALVAAVGLLLLGVAAVRGAFGGGAVERMTPGEPVLAPVRSTAPAAVEDASLAAGGGAEDEDGAGSGDDAAAAAQEAGAVESGGDEAGGREGSDGDGPGEDEAGSDEAGAADAAATTAAVAEATAAAAAGLPAAGDAAQRLAKDLGPGWQVVQVVEDWREVSTAEQIEQRVTRNLGMGDTQLALTPLTSPPVPGPLAGILGTWRINEARPNDFVGFNRDLDPPQDWSGGDVLALWLDAGDRPRGNVVFQFREGAGSQEVWRFEDTSATVPTTGPLLLPLDDAVFAWAPWSRESDGIIQREAIDQYGFYVGHAGPDLEGGFMLGAIAVVRRVEGD